MPSKKRQLRELQPGCASIVRIGPRIRPCAFRARLRSLYCAAHARQATVGIRIVVAELEGAG